MENSGTVMPLGTAYHSQRLFCRKKKHSCKSASQVSEGGGGNTLRLSPLKSLSLSPRSSRPTSITHKLPLGNKQNLRGPDVGRVSYRDSVWDWIRPEKTTPSRSCAHVPRGAYCISYLPDQMLMVNTPIQSSLISAICL